MVACILSLNIVEALIKNKKIVLSIVAVLVLVSVGVAGYVGYAWYSFGRFYENLSYKFVQSDLNALVHCVERYRVKFNKYPHDLNDLEKLGNVRFSKEDHSQRYRNNSTSKYLYYRYFESEDKYYLLGVGYDGIPLTEDDILPEISKHQEYGLKFDKIHKKITLEKSLTSDGINCTEKTIDSKGFVEKSIFHFKTQK